MRIIGGTHGGRRFSPPANIPARPTTDLAREGLFNILQNGIDLEDIDALELFGGTGGVTYELVSRGAKMVTVVEQHGGSVAFIKKMVAEYKMDEKVRVVKGDVFGFLKSCKMQYDLIFADPPYALPELPQLPDIVFDNRLLKEEGMFVLEHDGTHSFERHSTFKRVKKYGDTYFSFFT